MSEEKALELGFKPKAYLRAFSYVGVDPFDGTYCTYCTYCCMCYTSSFVVLYALYVYFCFGCISAKCVYYVTYVVICAVPCYTAALCASVVLF
jgi:hypothetical protein